ncbi:hypothetical protein [Candidatus Palauibacter sp.]
MPAGYRLSHAAEDELEEILLYVVEQSGIDRAAPGMNLRLGLEEQPS